jgi:hypothetical protein
LAPYELTLFSFLDAEGREQDFTTTDPAVARARASRHGLVILHNRYEFVTSEPLPDPKGNPPATEGRRRHPAPRRQAKRAPSPESPAASGPTREEVLALLSRLYHQRLGHDFDCPCLHGGECLCLRREIGQALAAAGLQP